MQLSSTLPEISELVDSNVGFLRPRNQNQHKLLLNVVKAIKSQDMATSITTQVEAKPSQCLVGDSNRLSSLMQKFEDKDFAGIIEEVELKLQASPPTSELLNNLGYANSMLGNHDKALDYYLASLKLNGSNVAALKNLALELNHKNEFDSAIRYLVRLLLLSPNDAEALNMVAYNYHCKGNFTEAVKYYNRSLGVEENYITYHNLGEIFRAKEEYSKAIEFYHKAINANPKSYDTLVDLGITYGEIGLLNEAIDKLQSATVLNNLNPIGWHNLGFAYKKNNQREKAIESFEQALKVDESYYFSSHQLGLIAKSMDNLSLAESHFKKVLEFNPSHYDSIIHLGLIYLELNEFQKSIELFSFALKLSPSKYAVRHFIALAFEGTGNLTQAIVEYEQALVLHKEDFSLWLNAAIAYDKVMNLDKSFLYLKKAIELEPTVSKALVSNKNVFSNLGKKVRYEKLIYGGSDESLEIDLQSPSNNIGIPEKVANALDDDEIDYLEASIPMLANSAFKESYWKALSSGQTVIESIDGKLIETSPNGTRRLIKELEPFVSLVHLRNKKGVPNS